MRRLAGACALVLIGAGLVLWLRPSAPEAILLSDAGGPITLAAGSLRSARQSVLRNAELTAHIVNALPERVRVLLLVSDRDAFSVARNPWPERIAFVSLPVATPLTIWPQDPFLVLRTSSGAMRLLASSEFERADDREMAAALASALGWELRRSELRWEGGNIVSDEAHAFVGSDTVLLNALARDEDELEVARRFERELGRPVLVVGPSPQPIAHIDMMLTPLGDGRVALADPAAGARIAERVLREQPDTVAVFERDSEALFFGDPRIRELVVDGEPLRAPELAGATAHAIAESRELAPVLDATAAGLEAHGYEIVRVPVLLRRPQPPDEGEPAGPGYPVLTYNNVLLERSAAGDVVYLPQYGLAALDEAARGAWQGAGYEVRPVPGLIISAMYGGALRCAVKVLAREEPP